MRLSALITPLLALATCLSANAQRYCNPLPMPIGLGGNASGDVTVLEEGGKYYMCCTGGGMWVSDNLLDWEFHAVEHIPVASTPWSTSPWRRTSSSTRESST